MKPLSRRSVTTGLAAAVTAIPGMAIAMGGSSDPVERIKHHTRELEKAMRDCYPNAEMVIITAPESDGINPHVMVCAKIK